MDLHDAIQEIIISSGNFFSNFLTFRNFDVTFNAPSTAVGENGWSVALVGATNSTDFQGFVEAYCLDNPQSTIEDLTSIIIFIFYRFINLLIT